MQLIWPAQHPGGIVHPPLFEGLAYACRGNRSSAVVYGSAAYDLQSQIHGRGGRLVRTAAVAAHTVVVAEKYGVGPETVPDHLLQVIPAAEGTEFTAEVEHLHPVHPKGAYEGGLLTQGTQKSQGPGVLLQNGAGMGPESDDHTLPAPGPCGFDKLSENFAVSNVDTVKETGRYNHFTRGKS